VHGVDAASQVVIRRQLKRRHVLAFFQKLPPCLVGIEACASSHHWSRELQALGHTVRLMPPAYVKPYVKRQKNDTTDAEAICEAVSRPNMRFVPTKTIEQQSCLMLHRARHFFIRQQTAVINSIRAYLAEFGIVALSEAGASSNCWKSSPTQTTAGSRKWPAHVLLLSAANCGR
jgi:transposase